MEKHTRGKVKGTSLMALVITLIVLLMLSGITIATLSGDNGIINRSLNAKDAAAVKSEMRIVEVASNSARGKNKNGIIEEQKLKNELATSAGKDKTSVEKCFDGAYFLITFLDSKRVYRVDNEEGLRYLGSTTDELMSGVLNANPRRDKIPKKDRKIEISIRTIRDIEADDRIEMRYGWVKSITEKPESLNPLEHLQFNTENEIENRKVKYEVVNTNEIEEDGSWYLYVEATINDGELISDYFGDYVVGDPIEDEDDIFMISYVLNGGTNNELNPSSYTSESEDITLLDATRTGYTFTGWTGNGTTTPTKNLVLPKGSSGQKQFTANWEANTYTIAFNKNSESATGEMADLEMTYGVEKNLTQNTFTRTGYEFGGWNTKADGTGTNYSDGQKVKNLATSGEITLYAKWNQNARPSKPIITANYSEGNATYTSGTWANKLVYTTITSTSTENSITTIQYSKDNKATWNNLSLGRSGGIKNTGSSYYGQENWTVTNGRNDTIYFRVIDSAGNISEESDAFNIKYDTVSPVITANNITFGETLSIRLQDSLSGVVAWQVSSSSTEPSTGWTTITSTTDKTVTKSGLTAGKHYIWAKDEAGNVTSKEITVTYLVTYEKGTNVTSIGKTSETTTGTVTLPTITASNGYTVQGWYNGNTKVGNAEGQYTVTGNVTLTAKATANTYTVSFNNNGGTGGQSSNVTATYNAAMPTISTTAPTKKGYTFMGWYDNSNYAASGAKQYYTVAGASARSYDKTSNTTLYAGWKANQYTLTINPNGGTWNNKTTETAVTQDYNTTYNVANNATKAGYIFGGWKLTSGNGDITYFTDGEIKKQYIINSTSAAKPSVYNNKGNGTVTLNNIADSTSSTGYSMKIVTNGEASPGTGGFYNGNNSQAGVFYYHKIVAKVPTGYNLTIASNSTGVNYGGYWITDNAGTGEWKTYLYIQYAGYNKPFSSFGHVYLSGSDNTSVTWYLQESTIYQKGTDLSTLQATNEVFKFVDSNATLTAQWKASGENLVFDKQGGTFGDGTTGTKWSQTNKNFIYDTTYTATKQVPHYTSSSDFSIYKTGYTFDGWYTAATGGTKLFDKDGKLVPSVSGYSDANRKWLKYDETESITIYARWTPNVYKVTLNNQGATTPGTTEAWYQFNTTKNIGGVTAYYYSDSECTTPLAGGYNITKPTKLGYTFKGYYTGENGTGTQYVSEAGVFINNIYKTVAEDTTLYAKWNVTTLTFNGATLSEGTYGTAYTSEAFTAASGGSGNYKYEIVSGAPTGASIDGTNGINRKIKFTATTPAGTYNVVVKATDTTTGASAQATFIIKINKQTVNPITVTTPQTWSEAYATTAKTKTITEATGAQGTVTYEIQSQKDKDGTAVEYFTLSGTTLTRAANTPVNKSIYTVVIRATAAGNSNYEEGYKDITVYVTVTKANGSGSVTMDGWTYGETAKNPVATSETNGTDHVTYKYKVSTAADSTYNTTKPSNVGTYTVQATFAATENYNTVTATANFTIAKAENPGRLIAEALTFDTTAQKLAYQVDLEGYIYYSVGTELTSSNYTTAGTKDTVPSRTNAGTYTVYYYATGNNNYKSKSGHVDATIAKYDISVEGNAIIATIGAKTYTGSAITPTPQVTVPIPSGSTTVLVNNTDFTYGYENNINVGTATIKIIAKANSNYTGTKTGTFEISPKQAIDYVSNNYTGNYDGNAKTFTLNVTEPTGCTIYYKEGNEPLTASNYQDGTTTTKPTKTDAGVTTVQWYIESSDPTYNDLAGSNTITINKVKAPKPTVTAYNAMYDGAGHSVTVTGVSGGTVEYSSDNESWTDSLETVTYTGFTNGAETVYVRVAGDHNHNNSDSVQSSVTISKRQVTVTANDKTKVYGEAMPALTYTIGATGVTGENANVTGSLATEANASSNVGTYDITKGTLALANNGAFDKSNYTLNFVKGTLTITKANIQTPTVSPYSGIYDGAEHGVTVTGASGGTVQYSTDNSTWDTQPIKYTDVTNGAKTVYVKVVGDGNHNNSETVTSSITINKKSITVTANNANRAYGVANPTFTATIGATGITGETGATSGAPTSSANTTSAPGYYDITGGNLALANNGTFKASNYSMTFTKGTLRIDPVVTFNANGGSGTMTNQVVTYNSATELEENAFTRDGYAFDGWAESASGAKVYSDKEIITITTNKTLFARWNQGAYSIVYDLDGGSVNGNNPETYTVETNTFTLINPTKTGYTFKGWTGSNGNTPQTTVTIPKGSTGNKSYTANWQAINYNVTFDANGGTPNPATITRIYEQPLGTLPTVTRTGYTFEGWYIKLSDNQFGDDVTAQTTMPASNLNLIAKWTPKTNTKYKVNHYVHDLGTNTYTLDSKSFETGETDSTLILSNLKKTIAGFTYEAGFADAGDTTKPTSGAVTQTTIKPDGTRVINLYYRRNRLYVRYHVNGGTFEGNASLYEDYNSVVRRISHIPTAAWGYMENREWVGVYGGTVNEIIDANTYATGNKGLEDYNDSSNINITKTDYKAVSVHKAWITSNGAVYSQLKNNYTAEDFANMDGRDLANGDVNITLRVNWVKAVYEINYVAHNGYDLFYADTLKDAVAYAEPPDERMNIVEEDLVASITQTGGSTITLLVNNYLDSSEVVVSKKVTFKPNSYKLTRTQQIAVLGPDSEFTIYGGGEVYLAKPSETENIPAAKQRLIFVGNNGKLVKNGSSILRSYTKVIYTWGVKDANNRGAIVELTGGYLESVTDKCIHLQRAGDATITNSYVTTQVNTENAIRVDDPSMNLTIGGTAKVGNGTDGTSHSDADTQIASVIGYGSAGTLTLKGTAAVYSGPYSYCAIAMTKSGTNNTATLYCAGSSCIYAANFDDEYEAYTMGRCIGARQGVTLTFSGNKFYAASKYVAVWTHGDGSLVDGTLHVWKGTFFSTAKQKFYKSATGASYTGTADNKTIQVMNSYNTTEDYLTTYGYTYTK